MSTWTERTPATGVRAPMMVCSPCSQLMSGTVRIVLAMLVSLLSLLGADDEVCSDYLSVVGLELAPELVQPGRRERVVEGGLGPVAGRRSAAVVHLVARAADLLAVGVREGLRVLAQNHDVRGGPQVRLQ